MQTMALKVKLRRVGEQVNMTRGHTVKPHLCHAYDDLLRRERAVLESVVGRSP